MAVGAGVSEAVGLRVMVEVRVAVAGGMLVAVEVDVRSSGGRRLKSVAEPPPTGVGVGEGAADGPQALNKIAATPNIERTARSCFISAASGAQGRSRPPPHDSITK